MTRVRFRQPYPGLSERACKAFQLAHQEAQRLNHPAVGIEHLLLGLAKDTISSVGITLHAVGYHLPWLRRQVERLNPPGSRTAVLPSALPYTSDLDAFIETAIAAGESTQVLPLTPAFLLAALVNVPDEAVIRILRQRRMSLWRLRRRLRRIV